MKRFTIVLPLLFASLLVFSGIPAALAASKKVAPEKTASNGGLQSPFGLGLLIGEPTGPTFKLWLPDHHAIDGGLAFSLRSFFLVYADYLFHFPRGFGTSSEFVSQLDPYIGGGAVLFFSTKTGRADRALYTESGDSVAFGARIPLGIEWMVPKTKFGLYVELVPGVGFFPATFAFLQGGIGGRFFF